MVTNLLAWLSVATVLLDCSSPMGQTGHEPVIRADAGPGDARGSGAADARDAAAACAWHAGDPADFTLQLIGPGASGHGGNSGYDNTNYQGLAAVTGTDAGDLQLLGSDGTRATFGGLIPPVPTGGSLWMQLRSTLVGNPFNPQGTNDFSVSAAEGAPVLAESVVDYVPAGTTASMRFLGAPVSFSVVCATEPYGLGSRVGDLQPVCLEDRRYGVTIHGDTDVTFTVASPGRVTIGGVEYEVWVTDASDTSIISHPASDYYCIPADWEPKPGLSLSGRAVDYQRLLDGRGINSGIVDGSSGSDASR